MSCVLCDETTFWKLTFEVSQAFIVVAPLEVRLKQTASSTKYAKVLYVLGQKD